MCWLYRNFMEAETHTPTRIKRKGLKLLRTKGILAKEEKRRNNLLPLATGLPWSAPALAQSPPLSAFSCCSHNGLSQWKLHHLSSLPLPWKSSFNWPGFFLAIATWNLRGPFWWGFPWDPVCCGHTLLYSVTRLGAGFCTWPQWPATKQSLCPINLGSHCQFHSQHCRQPT